MKNICLYFQVHHPICLQTFRFFDIGEAKPYYNESLMEKEIQDAIINCYIPTNEHLLNLIQQYKGKLKLSFNITDTTLDQFLIYSPNIISSFRQLADTGLVEFTGTTASYSIVSLSEKEDDFMQNIKQSLKRIEYYFGQKPKLFVNTDLLFNNRLALNVAKTGYPAIFTNGVNRVLQWRSPNYLYCTENQTKILFRNEKISNDLSTALRCSEKNKALKLLDEIFTILSTLNHEEPIVNIYLNYNLLGGQEIVKKQQILDKFVSLIIKSNSVNFNLPSKIIDQYEPVSEIGTTEPICWVEHFHPSYYPGNELQKEAIRQLFKFSKKLKNTHNNNLKTDWQYLQSSDHIHLMDENHPDYQHKNINSRTFKSKYEAYINFMNILSDFRVRLKRETKIEKGKKTNVKPFQTLRKHPLHEFK